MSGDSVSANNNNNPESVLSNSSPSIASSVNSGVSLSGIPVPGIPLSVWNPVPGGLSQVVPLFRDPPSGVNSNDFHTQQYNNLQTLQKHPEFNNYLAYILSQMRDESDAVRCRAGFQLKNNVRDSWETVSEPVKQYIKTCVLMTVGDNNDFVRNTVGTIITTICTKEELRGWPGLLEFLIVLLDSNNFQYMDGAFNALSKICEDLPSALDSEELGRPLNFLIPKFLNYFVSPFESIRKYALSSVNVFLPNRPVILVTHMEKYMQSLFMLTQDPNPEIKKRVCQAFVLLLEVEFQQIEAQIENIIKFMIVSTADDDHSVALEACEFWTAYCDNERSDKTLLYNYLPNLVQVLLKGMIYTDVDICLLQGDSDDEGDALIPDRPEDIRPRFHKSRVAGGGGGGGGGASSERNGGNDEDDVDDSGSEDDDWNDEDVSNWNLRKCSAASLDTLATTYQASLLPILIPLLNTVLTTRGVDKRDDDEKWKIRESGVLALGAIAEGCYEAISSLLKDLIPFLIESCLKDSRPLVRSITCWTLSRYSRWVLYNEEKRLFPSLLAELLRRILDKNKKVQEAACSAFATLEEEAQKELVPFLLEILRHLMYAFQRYQAKNMLILYDAIGTLAEAVNRELNNPEAINLLMPPLMERWNSLADNDRNIFPLLECLTSVASALGMGFAKYAQNVFDRCCSIIHNTLLAQERAAKQMELNPDVEYPDTEFIVCALDLLSGLSEGLYDSMEPLIANSRNIMYLIYQCIGHNDPDVRQSGFALLGDLAKHCIGHITPYLEHFMTQAACNLLPKYISVCNNASWCIGEIAVKVGGEPIKNHVPQLMSALGPIINTSENVPASLLENTAITIGRLAKVCPDLVSPSLNDIARNWCLHMGRIRDKREKEDAFRGLFAVLKLNPSGMLGHGSFAAFCAAIHKWESPPEDLSATFRYILHAYKRTLDSQWPQLLSQCPEDLQAFLSTV